MVKRQTITLMSDFSIHMIQIEKWHLDNRKRRGSILGEKSVRARNK